MNRSICWPRLRRWATGRKFILRALLVGYEGQQRPEKANIIIRRLQLDSASNDIGFAKTADGRYVAQLSEYDQRIGFDQKWLNRVHQLYKEKQTIVPHKSKGYIFKGREVTRPNKVSKFNSAFRSGRRGDVSEDHHDYHRREGK